MNQALAGVVTLLVYPGLLTFVALWACVAVLGSRLGIGGAARDFRTLLNGWKTLSQQPDGIAGLLGIGAAALACALFPWAYHPLDGLLPTWLWSWLVLEIAFLLPLLPALSSGNVRVAYAAQREAQIGLTGRMLLWTALISAMLLPLPTITEDNTLVITWLARGSAVVAAILAVPAACGWGAFAAETAITPGGAQRGLDEPTTALFELIRAARTSALLAAIPIFTLYGLQIPPAISIGAVLVSLVLGTMILHYLDEHAPRMPLQRALRMTWLRVLPFALLAALLLGIRTWTFSLPIG